MNLSNQQREENMILKKEVYKGHEILWFSEGGSNPDWVTVFVEGAAFSCGFVGSVKAAKEFIDARV